MQILQGFSGIFAFAKSAVKRNLRSAGRRAPFFFSFPALLYCVFASEAI
jgi:hypothetical protein